MRSVMCQVPDALHGFVLTNEAGDRCFGAARVAQRNRSSEESDGIVVRKRWWWTFSAWRPQKHWALEHPYSPIVPIVSNMCCLASKMLKMEALFAAPKLMSGLVMWISTYFNAHFFLGQWVVLSDNLLSHCFNHAMSASTINYPEFP